MTGFCLHNEAMFQTHVVKRFTFTFTFTVLKITAPFHLQKIRISHYRNLGVQQDPRRSRNIGDS